MTSTVDAPLPAGYGPAASPDAVRGAVRATCQRIAPLWPLERFVAVNPYLGMADHRFVDAAALLARTAGARGTMPASYYLTAVDDGRIGEDDLAAALADVTSHAPGAAADVAGFLAAARAAGDDDSATERVPTVAAVATATTGRDWSRLATERVSTWASSYFDQGQALWRAADPSLALFTAWKEEAEVDRTPEVMGLVGFRTVARELPDDAPSAIQAALDELGVPAEALETYLHAVLLGLGGWSAHAARIVWESGLVGDDDDTLEQFLAVLLGWEVCLLRTLANQGVATAWQEATVRCCEFADEPAVPEALARRLVLQYAFDRAEQLRVAALLSSRPNQTPPAADDRPQVQAVFCIDVRSEVFRRHLEAAGDVDTIGFAGFFGFPVEYVPIAHDSSEAQLPVLLTAAHTVYETVPDGARQEEAVEHRRLAHHVRRAWKSFKMGAISCFTFVGPVGLIYLPKLFSDSYGWTRPVPNPEDEGLARWAVEAKGPGLLIGEANNSKVPIPLDDRIQLAEGALRAMSLTDGFARLVFVSGHGATTVNNPYDTGLDCGACGGHTGEANARIAAAVLDDPEVRQALASRNVVIPADTWFVAGQHNTTTDEVTVYDRSLVPATHIALVSELVEHLAEAGRRTRAERAGRLGIAAGASVDRAVMRRANEWAQVRPEWGLAGCRAFVVAPRYRTHGLDLGGRSFLHSYDWRQDEGFGVLNLIMTAPMVVASWINLQYYASTVDNTLFGSGNKTLHNVVGRLGVFEGNAGDLRVGLPWQSLHDGETLQHEPLRLNVVIEAPMSAMNDVLAANPGVRDLCDNDWVHLLAMDGDGTVSHRYVGELQWEPIAPVN